MQNLYCDKCFGFCPSGTLANGLCNDCDQTIANAPAIEERRQMTIELIRRHPDWRPDLEVFTGAGK